VSADGSRCCWSRYTYGDTTEFHLVERTCHRHGDRDHHPTSGLTAEYAIDGSGDFLITNEVDEVAVAWSPA
jgi:hypothetical protein